MVNIWLFLGIELGIGIGIILFLYIRTLFIRNKKLNDIVSKQNAYLENMYEVINGISIRVKQIDKNGLFQGDDEVGFFFQGMKQLSEELEEYIKFIK